MKPRTNAQREALELSLALPALSARDRLDALRSYARIYAGKKTAWCSVCGHVWESDLWGSRKEKEVCPHCGARGKVVKSAGKCKSDEKYYASFVRVVKGWQWEMLKHMLAPSTSSDVGRWWKEIRVAMRNGYRIKDASLWLDMVDVLHKCGKDVRNPHYICPADLNEAHDAAMTMNARRLDKIAAQKAAGEKDKADARILKDGKLLSDEAEDQIDAIYEAFPEPGFCVRKDYDHFIRKY